MNEFILFSSQLFVSLYRRRTCIFILGLPTAKNIKIHIIPMTDQQMKSISVEDLLRSGNISRRTYNILVKARLRTLFDLKKYQNGLKRLFSPQSPNLTEVTQLIERARTVDYLPNISGRLFMDTIVEKSAGEQLLDSLSEEEMQLLQLSYDNVLRRLFASRQRAHTVIANALTQVSLPIFLRDFLYDDDDKIMILYNVGRTSVNHFVEVKKAMKNVVDIIQQQPEMVRYHLFLQRSRGRFDDDAFILDFYNAHQRLPMLYILQQLIISNKTRAELRAFLNRYDVFEGRVELDNTPIDRSAYTIATYSNTIYDALFDSEEGWEQLDPLAQVLVDNDQARDDLKAYIGKTLVTEDDPQIVDVIQEERLLLAPTCIVGMLGKLLHEHYIALGGYPRSLLTAKAERWKHVYLIDRQFDSSFGFREMFVDFRDRVYARSTDNQTVGMDDFVRNAHADNPSNLDDADLTTAATILQTVVVGELELATEEDLRVVVPRRVEKSLNDRLYQILSENNEQPMALSLLTDIINASDGRKYVKATVSLALNKDPRFVNNGKKGLYALTEWQLPYFGSNADIVSQVLSQSDRPMESDEILDVLNQYPYNESLGKNELSSVISMAKDKFRKFGVGYYGLVDKEYDAELIKPGRNNFEADLSAFRYFVDTNHRLPSSKNSPEEKRLIYWFTRKKKEFVENAKWTASKREAFKEIIELVEKYQALATQEQPIENIEPKEEQPATQEGPESPEISEGLESPESPKCPEIPETQQASEIPVIPSIPDISDELPFIVPEFTEEPPVELLIEEELAALEKESTTSEEKPIIPEFQDIPESEETPEGIDIPESEEAPEGIDIPESVETPEGIDIPESVETPEGIDIPESVETPEGIDIPESVETPEGIDIPESVETSEGIDIHESVETPEGIDIPENEETLEGIDIPESVEAPESSVIPNIPDIPVISVISDIPYIPDWLEQCEAVRQFVAEHQREPLELFTKEHQLALWLQQQKDCWHKGLLSPEEEQHLMTIRDMLW